MALPHGNAAAPADTPEARAYNRTRRRLELADMALGAAFLVTLVATGWSRDLRDLAVRAVDSYPGQVFFYVLLLSVIAKLLGFALDYYAFRLEHRFHLSNQRLGSWLQDQLKSWLVGLVLGVIVVELIYLTIRSSPEYWWLIAWAVFIVLFVLLAQLAPVVLFPLFYDFVPLADGDLKARLVRLSERAGTRVRGVYEWKLSAKSNKANAALAGLGRTRRIILADTLLHKYTPEEIEAVLAHELGHHVHRHIFKSIGLQVAVTFFGFWAAHQFLSWGVGRELFDSRTDIANLPFLLLLSTALSLLLLPALNAFSRHNEREADLYCWKNIPAIGPFISAMNKLAEQNLAERSPSRWVEVLFHSHPAIAKRIQAAEAWASRHQR